MNQSYEYDAENRLKEVKTQAGALIATYTYDGAGLRVKKEANSGTSTVYVFSGTKVIAEYVNGAAPSSPTREYIYLGSQLLATIEGATTKYHHADHLSVRITTFDQYDGLGRIRRIVHQDGSVTTTDYSGNCATATDPASKKRKSCSDAAGRLTNVWEPDAGGSFLYETAYKYDALDNLKQVDQKGNDPNSGNWRTRTFSYNSLSQLLTASNPESGTISYTYDADGNLVKKVDARGVIVCYGTLNGSVCDGSTGYDALHRLTQKSYSDGTPAATFTYDLSSVDGLSILNPVGRLVKAATSNTRTVNSYDEMGRIRDQWQCTPANCGTDWFLQHYDYNKFVNITSQTNPFGTGLTLTQTYDSAARLTQIRNSWNDSEHPSTLASAFSYFPSGAVGSMTFGNNLVHRVDMNNRLQPCRIRLTTGATSPVPCTDPDPTGDFFQMKYGYNHGVADNGNVASWSASGKQVFTRNYSYDSLNRLGTMSGTGGSCTGLTWTYDPWGNRTNQTTAPGGGSCTEHHPTITAQNRIAELGYDAAGNVTWDPATSASYQYDAENRLVSSDSTLGNATYEYDANGRRVRKTVGGVTTDFLYDVAGNVVAERQGTTWTKGYIYFGSQLLAQYDNTVNPTTTYFVHRDHLGSTRLLTKVSQSVQECDGYYPYGELDTSVCNPATPTTTSTHKFTGKERDSESGLDYFGARCYASRLGRFMIPDSPSYSSLKYAQSWNLYAYTLNNPLRFTDPDGHAAECKTDAEKCLKAAQESVANKEAASKLYIDKKTEKAGWFRRVFLGQKTVTRNFIGIRGDVGAFKQLGTNASRMADLLTDKRVFGLSISTTYSPTYTSPFWQFFSGGAEFPLNGGSTSRTSFEGTLPEAWIDPNPATYAVDTDAARDGIPPPNLGEKTAHELLGHVWAAEIAGLKPGTAEHKSATIQAENEVRRTDPTRGQKTRHHD